MKGVSAWRMWKKGELNAYQLPTGTIIVKEEDEPLTKRTETVKQKQELANQRAAMEQFCLARGLAVDEWIEEIGSGLNFKRKKFLSLVEEAIRGEISVIVVAHKDRLCRFAYELIEQLVSKRGCLILIANQQSLSPQQELVEDLMAIIHCFSCRLYGTRSYRKEKEKAIQKILDIPD